MSMTDNYTGLAEDPNMVYRRTVTSNRAKRNSNGSYNSYGKRKRGGGGTRGRGSRGCGRGIRGRGSRGRGTRGRGRGRGTRGRGTRGRGTCGRGTRGRGTRGRGRDRDRGIMGGKFMGMF